MPQPGRPLERLCYNPPMKPWILLNPGPVNVTERVRRALLQPDLCHREKEFSDLLSSVRYKLLKLFNIEKSHTVAVFSGSGTTALESMLSSFAGNNKKVLVLTNGVYGDRIQSILEIHHTPVKKLSAPLGDFPKLSDIESVLKQDHAIHAIAMTHHETSTGMLNPLADVAKLAKRYGKIMLVDAISSLGAEELPIGELGLDYVAGTSGKCLHGFPGVSFVMVKKTEVPKLDKQKQKTLYLDLLMTLQMEEKHDVPFTPVVQIFYAFEEALKELAQEGLSNRIRSYAQKSTLLERGFMSHCLSFLVSQPFRSHVLTALWTPQFISYAKLHDELKSKGFIIYAGQSGLKDKIFRVSNLGNVTPQDLHRFLSELGTLLKRNGKHCK